MAVKVHETGYGKWKVPVIIIASTKTRRKPLPVLADH